jgi:hypothetical protein
MNTVFPLLKSYFLLKSIIFWDMTPCSPLLATCLLAGLLNYSSTLKMEAIRSSETSGAIQRTTRRHIPEDDTLRKKTRFQKREDRVHGSAMKKLKHTFIQKYFCLKF